MARLHCGHKVRWCFSSSTRAQQAQQIPWWQFNFLIAHNGRVSRQTGQVSSCLVLHTGHISLIHCWHFSHIPEHFEEMHFFLRLLGNRIIKQIGQVLCKIVIPISTKLTKKKIVALGGINKNNLKKINLLNIYGYSGISLFKQNKY